MKRSKELCRKTAETDITLALTLDGCGSSRVDTGCGFLDHMLTLFAKHGCFDLDLSCRGDLRVDAHHTVEDVGIVLGEAFAAALGDCRGITRYGSLCLPMDEVLVLAAVDLSGRACLGYELPFPTEKIGDFDTELCKEFFTAFARSAACTLHIRLLSGGNSHHIAEAAFKAVARALRAAAAPDAAIGDTVPSTKGVLG